MCMNGNSRITTRKTRIVPTLEKSFRSLSHGIGSSCRSRERDERRIARKRDSMREKRNEREKEREVALLHERKSREIKASNFLRIVRRISWRTSSSCRDVRLVVREERARRVGSCFSQSDIRRQMQSAKR